MCRGAGGGGVAIASRRTHRPVGTTQEVQVATGSLPVFPWEDEQHKLSGRKVCVCVCVCVCVMFCLMHEVYLGVDLGVPKA